MGRILDSRLAGRADKLVLVLERKMLYNNILWILVKFDFLAFFSWLKFVDFADIYYIKLVKYFTEKKC